MTTPVHIVLLGLRGAGKSTIARRLGERLHCAWVDLDPLVLIELDAPSVAEAWRTHGEPAFRAAEARVLERLLRAQPPSIIALGGGTPMVEAAAAALGQAKRAGRARLIYLHAPPEVLAARLPDADPNRPALITGGDARTEMAAVYAARDPVYRRLADAVVDCSAGVDEVVEAAAEPLG